jgi:hypothetical protein
MFIVIAWRFVADVIRDTAELRRSLRHRDVVLFD